jgi:hypothetical protein
VSAGLTLAVLLTLVLPASAATIVVDRAHAKASDEAAGTADAPLKTIAKGLALANPGDTVLVKAGRYDETVAITKSGEDGKPLTLQAAPGEEVAILGGLDLTEVSFVRVEGFKFTVGEAAKARKVFVSVSKVKQSEIARCEIVENLDSKDWLIRGIDILGCEKFTFRDSKVHHVDLGVNLGADKDCTIDSVEIGPWDHEDGLRMINCDGILIQNCHIQSEETYRGGHVMSGHIDGIQIIRKNDNLTIRNNYIHGTMQGIGCFTDSFGDKWKEPRKNLRIEGNLILTFNRYHAISMYRVENPVIINNTAPVSRIEVGNVTGDQGVVKNNIAVIGSVATGIAQADCNLWTEELKSGSKTGPHDLVKVAAAFVRAPTYDEATDYKRVAEFTEKKVFFMDDIAGRIAVGDLVEVGGDKLLRKVTAVDGKALEFDPPLPAKPAAAPRVANWKAGTQDFTRDYRLTAASPAVDSADGSVGRGKDRAGNVAIDVPGVADKGLGNPPYLDRGALEFVPPAK